MSRLPNHTERDQTPEHLHEAFDRVAELRNGSVSGPYGVLLHSPELAVRGAQLSNYVRWQSALTPVQREIAVMATAREFDAAVMWAGHVRLGREAGVREELIKVIAERRDLSELLEEEAEIVCFVREIFNENHVSDEAFNALLMRFGEQGVVDLVGLVGYYAFVGTVLNTFEIEPPEGVPHLP